MKINTIFILLLILTQIGNIQAQESISELSVDSLRTHTIQEVTVIGRQMKEIVPAQVLSGEQLQRLNSHSVSDALRYFSGVQIKDYGGIGGLKTVNIRSMGSQHVGVFYDGIQIGNAQNGTVDLGKFSLDNMEHISVYNGQKSNIFQSARDFASASAIYMETRKPTFKEGRDNNLNLKLKGGSFDLINASALMEHRYNDKLFSSVNLEFLNTSGEYKFRYHKDGGYDTTEVRRNGDVMFLRAEAALFGRINHGEWQIKGYMYNSKRGYPGAAVKKDYGISLFNEDRQKDRNFFFQGSVKQQVTDLYSYKIQAKYANDYMNYVMPPESTVQPMNNNYWQQEFYYTVANLFSFNRWWTANISTDFQWNKLNAFGTDMFNAHFVKPRRYSVLSAAATSISLRRFSIQESLLYTFVHDQSARGKDVADNKNIFTPTLIASFKPFERIGLDVRAFYKEIFRMPTFNDLYYVQLGNRLLKPEYTTQYNIGIVYNKQFDKGLFSSLNYTVDVYYNEVKDKIIATPTSNQLVWTMINLGYVEIRGIDMTLNPNLQIGEFGIGVRLSYTYQKAQDFTREKKENWDDPVIDGYGDQIPYIPWHSGSLILNTKYKDWDFNYSFIYTGERYMLGNNTPVNYIQPWYTHDMSLSRNISLNNSLLRVTTEVNNIFNQQYEVVKWYPMPGTNFKIILSYTL